MVQRQDGPLPRLVDQGLPVSPVVEKEGLVVHPVAEVSPEEGEYPVFRPDLSCQHPLEVGEAGEALEEVDLPVQMPHRLQQRPHRLVAELPQQGLAHVVQGTMKR